MRGRNRTNNKGPNPLTRSYESNGPDVKIRGTAQHIAEKYSQLARDAQSSGDPVAAENYHQHAEHYYRIIAAAQEQLREQYGYQRPFDDEGDDDGFGPGDRSFGNDDGDFGSQPQPFEARQETGRPDGERFDRNSGDRRERYSRNPRDTSRPDNRQDGRQDNRQDSRQDSRQDNRQDGRQDNRQDNRPDNRQDARPDFQREDRQSPRPERTNGRSDFRRDRRDEQPAPEETGSALPAFLTNPVRAPMLAVEGAEGAAPAAGAPESLNGEGNGEYRTRRRRRTRRGFGEDAASETGADFVPEVETPPAE